MLRVANEEAKSVKSKSQHIYVKTIRQRIKII